MKVLFVAYLFVSCFAIFVLASCKPKPSEYTWVGIPDGVRIQCGSQDHKEARCVGGGRVWLCIEDWYTATMTCAPYAAQQVEVP